MELLGLALGQPSPIKPFKLSFEVQLIVGTMLYLDLGPILEDGSGSYMLVVIQKSIDQKQKKIEFILILGWNGDHTSMLKLKVHKIDYLSIQVGLSNDNMIQAL